MDIEARFRRRARLGEDAGKLNDTLMLSLSKLDGFWKKDYLIDGIVCDYGKGESISVDLSPCLEPGIKASISYASRLSGSIVDKAISDDFLTVQLDLNNANYEEFCNNIFPIVIKVFEPYRAAVITDLDLDLDDYEEIVEEAQRTGLDVDGRDTVYRFYPVNFFDDTLCGRAFGFDSQELINRLSIFIKEKEKYPSGALITIANDPLNGEDLLALNNSIFDHLDLQNR
jgi:hypothetical protein